jgi:hypothetical protein
MLTTVMATANRFLLLSFSLLLSAACGSGDGTATSNAGNSATAEADVGDDTGEGADAEQPEPTGDACGRAIGQRLCDLDLEGFVRDGATTGLATEATRGPVRLSEILKGGSQRYALVWTSAYW